MRTRRASPIRSSSAETLSEALAGTRSEGDENHSAAWRTALTTSRSCMDAVNGANRTPARAVERGLRRAPDELVVLELQLIQTVINAAPGQQFLMRPGFAQLTLVQ